MEFDFLNLGIVNIFITFRYLDYWIITFKFSYAILNSIFEPSLFYSNYNVSLFHAIYNYHGHSFIIPSKNTIAHLLPTSVEINTFVPAKYYGLHVTVCPTVTSFQI